MLYLLVLAACGRSAAAHADIVVVNAKVFSADGSGSFAQALAIRGNPIVAVVAKAGMEPYIGPRSGPIAATGG